MDTPKTVAEASLMGWLTLLFSSLTDINSVLQFIVLVLTIIVTALAIVINWRKLGRPDD